MALDNAQFISELSIVDPPGTDPLSQGDDQIRTIKRATQQSFPNIDAAVTLTAVQMNAAAIKNEANIFTAAQTISQADLLLNQPVDGITSVRYQLAGLDAWALSMRDVPAFNQFQLRRFDALGVTVDVPFSVRWTDGVVIFDKVPLIIDAPLWIAGEIRQFVAAATPGANWFLANGLNGTVDLSERTLISTGTRTNASPGVALAANLNATAAAGTTGGTAITEAQMPAHLHDHGITQTDQFASDTNNIEDQSSGTVAPDPTRTSKVFTSTVGGGGTHNHSSPAQAVNVDDSATPSSVRPFSVTVDYYQYVP